TSGVLLSKLLSSAGYSQESRDKAMSFFLHCITPFLGPLRGFEYANDWTSFMTDDGTPIELGWGWTTEDAPPKIQYSIEPYDSHNCLPKVSYSGQSSRSFYQEVIKDLDGTDLTWSDHFSSTFLNQRPELPSQKQKNSIFYAFDIQGDGAVAKTYFILRSGSGRPMYSDMWAAISTAVLSAPYCLNRSPPSLRVLQGFFKNNTTFVDIEMLAIDLVQPEHSRIKIYFRLRNTCFGSVKKAMTLDGRLTDETTIKGLGDLERLWKLLFHVDSNTPLPAVDHRTAGILYYAEFRLGSQLPKVKLYIPVRHYAASDNAVIEALENFWQHQQGFGEKICKYRQVLKETFEQELSQSSGIQTYLGCSINSDGSLRLISYINPQVEKMAFPM
ncbi:aromatic prenyltransferase, partial [Bimuria novae-zelandiae CBS 107.79]